VRSIIQEGGSVAEAVAQALEHLGRSKEEVEIEVLEGPKKGWLGLFGYRPVRVRVTERDPEEIKITVIKEITRELLKLLCIQGAIEVHAQNGIFYVSVLPAKDTGLLIGRHGQTIDALEHVLGRIVRTRVHHMTRLALDVAGYRERQMEKVRRETLQAARRVLAIDNRVVTEPLTTDGLKVALGVIAKFDNLNYTIIGQGLYRNLVLSPKRSALPKG